MNGKQNRIILLIEGEELDAMVSKLSLERCGYTVHHEWSGTKVIEVIEQRNDINLIVMDVDLGKGTDGIDIAELIQKKYDIPIVFLSNHTEREIVEKTEKITSYGYVVKNSGITVLDASIKMAFKLFEAKKKEEFLFRKLEQSNFEILQRQIALDQHAIVAITDTNGTITYVNDLFCKISGYNREELLGNNHRIINSGYHPKEFFAEIYSTLKKGNTWHGEIQNRAKNGSLYWVDTTISPLKNADGEVEQFFAVRTLITEIKQKEEELKKSKAAIQESEAFARMVANNIPGMVGYWTKDLHCTFANPGYLGWFGKTSEQMIGIRMQDLLGEELFKKNEPFVREALSGKNQEFERMVIKPNGKKGYLWAQYIADKFEGEIRGFIALVLDITRLKEVEEELKNYTEELERINQTKNKFFSIIAHDLRNPFTGIIELSKIQEKRLLDNQVEKISDLLKYNELIQTTSKSAYALLENLMEWARTQTGEININRKSIYIKDLISSIIPIVSGNAYKKNIIIIQDIPENNLINTDESLVNTIIRNLLTNAIKFTNHNGKITITAKITGTFLEISVSDTGVGIETKNLDKIFKIDSKFSKLGTDNEKGTGLGLVLCKEFVEKLGGKIWAFSENGKGSTFTFSLPLT